MAVWAAIPSGSGKPLQHPTTTPRGITEWDWWRIIRSVLPFAAAFGAILVVETVAIAKIDLWLPVESFRAAARDSLYVSAVGLWLRLCVIGAAVSFVLKSQGRDPGAGFLRFWCIVSLGLALSLLLVDIWTHRLQFGDTATGGESQRWLWLATLYARVVLYYVAVRLLLSATCAAKGSGNRLVAAWTATTTLQSLAWFLALLAIKLFVDRVIVDMVSFVPVVAPFWFIPNELSPMRYFVGHGIEIFVQSCGVFFYVAFWIAADRRICAPVPDTRA